MATVSVELDEDLVALLHQLDLPVERAARELIVLELYRRGLVSSGKAAQLLSMSRWDFIEYASRLGIPFFRMTDEEWERERQAAETV
jgi:predicted HTH domain antitoxin